MHNTTAITTGSANQRPNTPCIRLWIDVTFRGLEDSYSRISAMKWTEKSPESALMFITLPSLQVWAYKHSPDFLHTICGRPRYLPTIAQLI